MNKLRDFVKSGRIYIIFLHATLVVLAVLVVVLSNQNEKLKEGRSVAGREQMKEGDTLRLTRLELVKGGAWEDSSSVRRLVFIMSTTCPFCKETIPYWKGLYAESGDTIEILAISLDRRDSTARFAEINSINFPIIAPSNVADFKKMNKITGVPITLVQERGGRVSRLWMGKLDAQKALEVRQSAFSGPIKGTEGGSTTQ